MVSDLVRGPQSCVPLRDDGVGPHVAVAGSIPASAIPKKGVSLLSKKCIL